MKTNNDERKLLLSKINDIISISQKRKSVCESSFLDPAEAMYIKRNIFTDSESMCFYGGYDDAERVVFAALMPWNDVKDIAVSCIKITINAKAELNHRDCLGAVLALGIERSVIGDICIKGSSAIMFVKSEICDFIVMNLVKIGKYNVSCEVYEGNLQEFTEKKYEEKNVNVSSTRLDAFISAVYNISRSSASEMISAKNVKLNYEVCTKPDIKLSENDLVSVRGRGRVRFLDNVGKSRKDRLYLKVLIYG